jgi:Domain of unknown function (DUF4384)
MLLLYTALTVVGSPAAPAVLNDRPPLQIWMNNDRRFRAGDRVRLQVDAEVDGYLLVLNYDTDGRVRVLFPLDPRDDAMVRAGRRYEVRDDGGDGAFRAGQDGTGLIYSAISRDPWRFDEVVLADRWDYSRLSIDPRADNPEAALTDLVQQLSGPGGFDYDVAGYRVFGSTTYNYNDYYARGPIYVYDDYYLCSSWYSRYSGCRSWPYDGWSLGFGFGYYGYRPYGYSYNPYSYPYYPYGHSVPVGRRPVIVGRPRNYTVFPRPASGTGIGSHSVGGNVASPPVNWRPRSSARPSGVRGPEVTRGSGETSVFMPPARRARSAGGDYPSARGGGGSNERGRGNFNPPARNEPRSYNPPERSQPSGGGESRGRPSGGDGGGHASSGGSGGHSAPARSRRP